jgi:hypothetical protein
MKQQAIQEKLKKLLPIEEISSKSDNYASSFCPAPSSSSLSSQREQRQDQLSDWPVAGSFVRVQLDSSNAIEGVVTADGRIADALRSTG